MNPLPKNVLRRPLLSRHLRPTPRRRLYHTPPPLRSEEEERQANPLEGYYKLLLDTPFTAANAAPPGLSRINQDPHPPPSTPATEPYSPNQPKTQSEQAVREEKARVVFGSRLAGPIERAEAARIKQEKGQWIHGVFVPPKPEEPDNCCMSGCVNCVLTRFVEELDEWKMAKAEARRRGEVKEREKEIAKKPKEEEKQGDMWEGFEDIPLGLRVFMETEKRLKGRKGNEMPA